MLHLLPLPRLPAGDSVTQVVSNVDDYAHWSWQHPTNEALWGNNCAFASNQYQYDYFLGNNQLTADRTTQARFQTTSADLKNGWTGTACNITYASVCMIHMSAFGCKPPPSPPPPPPAPPSPPSPPAPSTCEWRILEPHGPQATKCMAHQLPQQLLRYMRRQRHPCTQLECTEPLNPATAPHWHGFLSARMSCLQINTRQAALISHPPVPDNLQVPL